jgi:rRNA processing protein Gar1
MVVGIAADVISTVDNQYFLVRSTRQPFSQNAAGKPCAYDQVVKHKSPSSQF